MSVDQQTLHDQITILQDKLRLTREHITELEKTVACQKHQIEAERRESEKVLKELRLSELIVERSPVILFRRVAGSRTNGADPTLEYISQNITQFGYSPDDFLSGGIQYSDIVYPGDHEQINTQINNYADANAEEYTMVYRCVTKSGELRWVEDQTMVVHDDKGVKTHNQGIIIDITERKIAEDMLRKSEEKFRRIVESAAEGFVLMDKNFTIIDLNVAFSSMLGYCAHELLGKTPFDIANNESKALLLAQWEDIKKREIRKAEVTLVTKTGKPVPVLIHGNPLRDDNGKIIGNMSFVTNMTEHKKALVLAGEVQKSLLPQSQPQIHGFDIAGKNVSCDEIGGDYFDYIKRIENGHESFGVVVGDISGHGVDSALLMTTARAFLRMRASQPGTVAEIISGMNHHLTMDVLETDRFMTLFYLNLDYKAKLVTWVRAGHDPALLYTPSLGIFEELKGNGIALGVLEEASYTEYTRKNLEDGQVIAVSTDGVWEAFNYEGEMFGKERFQQIIAENSQRSAQQILDAVYEALATFTKGTKAEDDITLVIVKVDGKQ